MATRRIVIDNTNCSKSAEVNLFANIFTRNTLVTTFSITLVNQDKEHR